jgi:hypothetical protein
VTTARTTNDVGGHAGRILANGGAINLNGAPVDAADLMAALANEDLSGEDLGMMYDELEAALRLIEFRLLPFQYIPSNEGRAPTLNIRIPGGSAKHPQPWTIGAKWDRRKGKR